MFKTSACFNNISQVEIEVTMRATYNDWKELLDLINENKYPGSKFHEQIRSVLTKLERQVVVSERDL